MKTKLSILLLLSPLYSFSQEWSGSTPGDIYYNQGKVGVGTPNPSVTLQVTHNYQNDGVKIISNSSTDNSARLQLLYNYTSTANNRNAILELGRNTNDDGSHKWRFRASSTYPWGNLPFFFIEYLSAGVYNKYMSFKYDGNIGIGVDNPAYKLVVNGVISASEVKVSATPNSDYVFEPDYPLLPLSKVEAHIKERKHLPGIPSSEQFKENGVGLGEMDDMLLRKVEELTLYVIEQSKNNEKLLEQIEQLKKENESQATQIEQLKNKLNTP